MCDVVNCDHQSSFIFYQKYGTAEIKTMVCKFHSSEIRQDTTSTATLEPVNNGQSLYEEDIQQG